VCLSPLLGDNTRSVFITGIRGFARSVMITGIRGFEYVDLYLYIYMCTCTSTVVYVRRTLVYA
jgi:hypothetical protein